MISDEEYNQMFEQLAQMLSVHGEKDIARAVREKIAKALRVEITDLYEILPDEDVIEE